MKALMQAVQSTLEACGLFQPGAVLLCALSGGCDSVALLHALHRLRREMPFLLHAVHVQHGLRGEDSLADERFVRALCQSLNVPLRVAQAGLAGDMHTPGMETLARERRRSIFVQHMDALGADALLTAHHRDDQAETVLMHLLRGSGLKGLCGMQTASPFGRGQMIRPFLSVSKQQLAQALAAEGLPFCEDGSNREALTPRNALRLQVLPQLESLFPGASAHAAQLAQSLQADEVHLSQEADGLYRAACRTEPPLFMLDASLIAAAPEAIRRRAVRQWVRDGLRAAGIQPQEQSLSHADTLALDALALKPAGSRINLPCGLAAAKERHWLHLVHQSGAPLRKAAFRTETIKECPAVYGLPHLRLEACAAQTLPQDARSIVLSTEWLQEHPVLRTPQPQDQIRPFGAPGHKPLRRWFTDRKADPFLRSALPVLCVHSEVLWVPGLCASELLRLEKLPADALQLTLAGETPFIPKSPKE